jgi:hypothetical protein
MIPPFVANLLSINLLALRNGSASKLPLKPP